MDGTTGSGAVEHSISSTGRPALDTPPERPHCRVHVRSIQGEIAIDLPSLFGGLPVFASLAGISMRTASRRLAMMEAQGLISPRRNHKSSVFLADAIQGNLTLLEADE